MRHLLILFPFPLPSVGALRTCPHLRCQPGSAGRTQAFCALPDRHVAMPMLTRIF